MRYLGASSMWAWLFATMQHAADLNGWTRFILWDQYNLLQREEEREMFRSLPIKGGQHPVSPLAGGRSPGATSPSVRPGLPKSTSTGVRSS